MSAISAMPGYGSWGDIPELPEGVREITIFPGPSLLRLRRVGAHVEVVLYTENRRGNRTPKVLRYATRRGDLNTAIRHAIGDAELATDAATVVEYIRATPWGSEL